MQHTSPCKMILDCNKDVSIVSPSLRHVQAASLQYVQPPLNIQSDGLSDDLNNTLTPRPIILNQKILKSR